MSDSRNLADGATLTLLPESDVSKKSSFFTEEEMLLEVSDITAQYRRKVGLEIATEEDAALLRFEGKAACISEKPAKSEAACKDAYEKTWSSVDEILEKTKYVEKVSFFEGVMTLIAAMMGVGILTFPQGAQFSGFWTSMLIFTGVAVLSHLGGVYLGFAGRLTNETSLDKIAQKACGWPGVAMVYYSQVGITFLASVAYIIIMWKLLKPTLSLFVDAAKLEDDQPTPVPYLNMELKTLTMSSICLLLLYPCSLRDLKTLSALVSTPAIGVFVVMMALMIFEYFNNFLFQSHEEYGKGIHKWWTKVNDEDLVAKNHPCYQNFGFKPEWWCTGLIAGICSTISCFNTGCLCHFSCADLFVKELEKPTRKRVHKVMLTSLVACGITYFVFTLAGWNYGSKYQMFQPTPDDTKSKGICKEGVQEMVFDNFQTQEDARLPFMAIGITFAVFLGLFLTFPMLSSACRNTIHSILFGDKKSSDSLHFFESALLLFIMGSVAILVKSFMSVLAYAGAGPGAALVYIFPGMLMLGLTKGQSWNSRHRLVPLILFVAGILVSAVSLVVSYQGQQVVKDPLRVVKTMSHGENTFLNLLGGAEQMTKTLEDSRWFYGEEDSELITPGLKVLRFLGLELQCYVHVAQRIEKLSDNRDDNIVEVLRDDNSWRTQEGTRLCAQWLSMTQKKGTSTSLEEILIKGDADSEQDLDKEKPYLSSDKELLGELVKKTRESLTSTPSLMDKMEPLATLALNAKEHVTFQTAKGRVMRNWNSVDELNFDTGDEFKMKPNKTNALDELLKEGKRLATKLVPIPVMQERSTNPVIEENSTEESSTMPVTQETIPVIQGFAPGFAPDFVPDRVWFELPPAAVGREETAEAHEEWDPTDPE